MRKNAGDWPLTGTNGSFNAEWGRHGQGRARLFAIPAGAGYPFIGSEKRILDRCLRENGVILTPDARVAVDSLPETFLEWLAVRDRAEAA